MRRGWVRWLAAGLILAAMVWAAIMVHRYGVEALLPRSLPLAAVVLIGLFTAKSVAPMIPFLALFLAAGVIFPLPWSMVVVYVGVALNISAAYGIGKKIGRGDVWARIEGNRVVQSLLSKYEGRPATACFVLRLLPLPLELPSMFFGATDLGFWRHLAISLVGATPYIAPYVIAGRAVQNPLSPEFLVPFGISFGIAAIAFALVKAAEHFGAWV